MMARKRDRPRKTKRRVWLCTIVLLLSCPYEGHATDDFMRIFPPQSAARPQLSSLRALRPAGPLDGLQGWSPRLQALSGPRLQSFVTIRRGKSASGHWMTGAPVPTARTEVAVAALDGLIYVAGGFEPPDSWMIWQPSVSTKVEAYDPSTNRWSSKPELPVGLHHAGSAVVDGALYVVGGFNKSDDTPWNPSDRVFRFDPASETWVERAPLPTPRGGLAVTTLQGKLFAISGYNGQENPSVVEVYDPNRDQWTAVAPLPTPRDHLAAVTIGKTLYAIGGRVRLNYRENLSTVEAYHADLNQWVPRAGMPTPRSGMAASVLNGWVYVFGGESGEGTFHQNERYSAELNRWQEMAPMPTARHGLGAAEVNGYIYALSGGPRPGGSYSRLNEIFLPPSSSYPIQSGRTPASHIGSVMTVLATFQEAGALPPESSPEATQLIHALIQYQSVFLKSSHPVVQEFFASALSEKFDAKKVASLTKIFLSTGWTSETLEALVDYSAQRSMAEEPRLVEVLHGYNVTTTDWKFIEQTFTKARERLLKQGKKVHRVFAAQRASMPGGSPKR